MSQIRVNDIRDSAGSNSSTPSQIYSGRAKAWVNFNGSGTVAIRDDFNVNTITDNATGNYTINFSSALSNANYTAAGTNDSWGMTEIDSQTTTSCQHSVFNNSGSLIDRPITTFMYHGS